MSRRRGRPKYTVMKTIDAGVDSSDKWITICERHNTMVGSKSKKLAHDAAVYPEWCDECRATMSRSVVRDGE